MDPMSSHRLSGNFETQPAHDTNIEVCSREILGLPDVGPRDADINAVLQALLQNDFVPSTLADAAIRQCFQMGDDSSNLHAAGVIRTFIQELLDLRIDAFASIFFKLSVKERCDQWEELASQCNGFPALELRLAQLSPGLEAEAGAERLDLVEYGSIGARVQQLFVASRSHRKFILNQWEQMNAPDDIELVSQLKTFHPAIAALEPSFLSNLESQQVRLMRRYENRRRRSQVWQTNPRSERTYQTSQANQSTRDREPLSLR